MEGQYDIVHCDMPSLAYAFRKVSDERWTITDHDVSYLKAERLASNTSNPLLRLFLRLEASKLKRLEANLLRHADLGIAVSDHDRAILNRLVTNAKIVTVENGVDLRAVSGEPTRPVSGSMVWLGGFSHRPNVAAVQWFLKHVYPSIKSEFPAATFTVVGGEPPEWLLEAARNDSTICVTGFVEDPYPFLHRAAVFVAPVLSGSGTKLKVIEAMGARMAIVCTSVAAEGIDGTHGTHFLIADEPDKFAEAVVSLLQDENERGRLADAAHALASNRYDWRMINQRLSAAYCELAGISLSVSSR